MTAIRVVIVYRPLVCPYVDGGWYACVRWTSNTGNQGMTSLGGYPTDWDTAARAAIAAAKRFTQHQNTLS